MLHSESGFVYISGEPPQEEKQQAAKPTRQKMRLKISLPSTERTWQFLALLAICLGLFATLTWSLKAFHILPRYEYRQGPAAWWYKVDRWTGHVQMIRPSLKNK